MPATRRTGTIAATLGALTATALILTPTPAPRVDASRTWAPVLVVAGEAVTRG